MPPRKKPTTTPKAKAKSSKTTSTCQKTTAPGKPKAKKSTPISKQPAKKPSIKSATTKTSGKTTIKTPPKKRTTTKKPTTRKKPEPKPTFKRKELSHEEMFPFESFPFRLEYKDGTETRVCYFTCEEHRTKLINRYKLRKETYFIDDLTTT